ncbi:MAG TPA: hypothetical protein VJA94_23060 [Candidatus Angelobacter sp.]
MKKTVLGILLLFAVGSFAQTTELPRFETYLGYDFTRVHSAINVPAFSANGGIGEFAINLNKWLSGVASFPIVHNGNIGGFHVEQTLFGYMFGPRVNLRLGHIIPSFETLFGQTHDSRSFRGVPVVLVGNGNVTTFQQRVVNDATEFSMLAGGALDLAINKNVTFRPIKLDYYLTRFQPIFIPNLGNFNRNRNQNNLLYSTGINFRFGR